MLFGKSIFKIVMKPIYPLLIRNFSIIAILLMAAYLRLYKISEYMTFLGDEGRDVLVVMHMIVNHKFTLLGPTASVGGFFLGPVYYYFMLPFLWLWRLDPTGPAVMVALFGIATVFIVYKAGKDMFDTWVGIIAASLYAVSPVVISYSRSSWNPNLVPFFSISLIYLLWRTVVKDKKTDLFWIGIILGVGIQLHYLFIFLYLVTVIWMVLYCRSRSYFRYYLFGLVGFVIGYSPFLAFELRHGFPNTNSIIRFVSSGKDTGYNTAQFINNLVDVPFRLFGRLVFRLPTQDTWSSYGKEIFVLVSMTWSFLIASMLYLMHSVAHMTRLFNREITRKKNISTSVALNMLSIWFFVCLVLFGLYKRGIYDYYFGIWFGLPFLLVGIILSKLRRLPLGLVIMCLIFGWLLNINWRGRPFIYSPNNQIGQVKSIARSAMAFTDKKPFNFALITNFNSDHAYRYFFEIWGNKPVTIENVEKDPDRKTATDQLIVICELSDCKPLGHPLWEIAGFGRAEIVGQLDVPFVKIFKLVHYNEN